jgi:hypothetical protein
MVPLRGAVVGSHRDGTTEGILLGMRTDMAVEEDA